MKWKKESQKYGIKWNPRIFSIFVALIGALFLAACGIIGRDTRVKGAELSKIKVGALTVSGTVGTPITDQTLTLTVENGKFDTVQFYIGRDISDFFRFNDMYHNANRTWVTNDAYASVKYIMPVGLKVVITKTGETEIICKVSGTPLTPSRDKIKVWFLPTMFSERNVNNHDSWVDFDSSLATWDIKPVGGKWEKMSLSIDTDLTDKLSGKAGETVFDIDFSISLKNGIFVKNISKDTDVTNWFSYHEHGNLLPIGLKVKTTSDIKLGDTSCALKLYGTSTYSSTNTLKAKIPIDCIACCYDVSGAYYSCHEPHYDGDYNTTSNNYQFAITGEENESPYLAAYSEDVIVYAGQSYGNNSEFRVYFSVNNVEKGPSRDDLNALTNNWLYSNQEGSLDKSAPGFLYSPGNQPSNNKVVNDFSSHYPEFYMNIIGIFKKTGIYDISYFIPLNMFEGHSDDTGNTPVVKNGRLIVRQPFTLDIENTDLSVKIGATVDTYITVRPSYKGIWKKFDSDITTETLKYSVSEKIKALGLDLTPVCVNEDFIVFKLSGTISGRPTVIDLSDCITLNYESVKKNGLEDIWKGLGDISINTNEYATLTIVQGSIPYPQDFENDDTDIIVYAKDAKGVVVEETFINMTKEKLASDIPYKCYSVNGGNTWKETTKFTDKQIDAMLKKGMTLAIAEKYDKKTKQPADGTTVYYFDTINKRPAAPKLKVEFKTYEDPTGYTPGQWMLADSSFTALDKTEREKYEYGLAGSDKKTISSKGYNAVPEDTGIDFEMTSGKTADSTIYLVRTKATKDTPASKAAKITVKGQGKASKLKVDYKKEILKAKSGMVVYFGETISEEASEIKNEPKTYSDFAGKYIVVDAAMAKTGIDISGYLTDTRNTILIWTEATNKKASTVAQTIKLAKRDTVKAVKLSVTDGKLTLDKKYEVYDETKGKWGNLPKITDSCTLKIRLKPTAKGGAENDSSYAASNTGTLKITYDVIDAEKNKSGITSAEIITG